MDTQHETDIKLCGIKTLRSQRSLVVQHNSPTPISPRRLSGQDAVLALRDSGTYRCGQRVAFLVNMDFLILLT